MRKSPRKIKKLEIQKLSTKELTGLNIDDEPGWWVYDPNTDDWVGPYDTKKDAQAGKMGLERFWRYHAV